MKRTSLAVFATMTIAPYLSLAGCSGSEKEALTIPEGAQAGQLVGMEPCTYEINDIEYEADCGILVVPENRTARISRLIGLPITRIRSTGTSPAEAIFFLPGGPGESNTGTSRLKWFIDSHDFVIVGYRGVDGSVRLDCPEVSAHIKNLPGDMLGAA